MIAGINPGAIVEPVDAKINTAEAKAAIAAADVVFGCLDRDLPRLKLTQLCSRYAKPLFDLATDTGGERDDLWYGGRVLFFANGAGCLVCRNLLDQQEMTRDSMSPEQREVHDRIYGVERGGHSARPGRWSSRSTASSHRSPSPSSLVFVTGMREPVPHLIYRGHAGFAGLSRMGRAGIEPATLGLKVRPG